MKKTFLPVALAILAFFLAFALIAVMLREPRSDRKWTDEVARTAETEVSRGSVLIRNVRDFTYGDKTVASRAWIDAVSVSPGDIARVWFVLEPFAEWEAVGHTFLTFEFKDGSAYSFSVEARKEEGESYSAFWGLFRQYELAYTWGTERDFVSRRLLLLDHPVRMYPLAVDDAVAQSLFVALAEETQKLADSPRFYHTLSANCTNVLAEVANGLAKDALPYDLSWNLPGLSDEYLMREQFIGLSGSVADTKAAADLTKKRAKILEMAELPPEVFSEELRTLLGATD